MAGVGGCGTIIPRINSQGNALCGRGKKINNMIRGNGGAMGNEAKAQSKFSWLSHNDMKNVVILIETPRYASCHHNKDLYIASYLFLMMITIQIPDEKPAHPKV